MGEHQVKILAQFSDKTTYIKDHPWAEKDVEESHESKPHEARHEETWRWSSKGEGEKRWGRVKRQKHLSKLQKSAYPDQKVLKYSTIYRFSLHFNIHYDRSALIIMNDEEQLVIVQPFPFSFFHLQQIYESHWNSC